MTYTKTSPFLRFSPFWAFFRQKGDNCSPQAIKRGREGKETPSAHPERLQRKAVGGRRAAAPRSRLARPCVAFFCAGGMGGGQQSRPSAARPAPSPPALAAAPSSVGVVVPLLGVGWRWGNSRARWPPLRRPSGRLGRWPRSPVRPRDGLARGLCALSARPRLASGRLLGRWPQRLP